MPDNSQPASPQSRFWMFEFTAEQMERFDSSLRDNGIEVRRERERVTKHLSSHLVETRIEGFLVRNGDEFSFSLDDAPHVDLDGNQAGSGEKILTLRGLPRVLGEEEDGRMRALALELERIFPNSTGYSPQEMERLSSKARVMTTLIGVLAIAVIVALLALAAFGAYKLFQ